MVSSVLDDILAVVIVVAVIAIIYISIRKQSFTELVDDIRGAFSGGKNGRDGQSRIERYYR